MQPVAFLCISISLGMPSAVIYKRKKITLAQKPYRRYWSNKVSVNELIRVLGLILRYSVIDLSSFCLLATIAHKVLRVFKIRDL